MKQLLFFLFSITTIFGSCHLYGQDTTAVQVSTGLSLYVDYGKLLTLPSDFEMKIEAGVSVRLRNRLSPNIQVGMGKLQPSGAIENGNYQSEGWYGRAGLNYLIPFDPVNTLYAGVKYAVATYEEKGSYEIGSKLWPSIAESYHRQDLTANWFEIILGSEKRLMKTQEKGQKQTNWSLGGYFSLRILNQREELDTIDTYAIPGYGRAFDNTVPALNVYVRYGL